MGQCWTKQRKKGHTSKQAKYAPSQSDSQQPIVNGGISTDVSAGASQHSIDKQQTQHISDREIIEPESQLHHPADYPKVKSLFVHSSTVDLTPGGSGYHGNRRKSYHDYHSSDNSPVHQLKRSNSTSTIYLHETVSQPNMKNTIKAVALAIFFLIKNRKSHLKNGIGDETDEEMQKHLEIFDEKLHPLTEPVSRDYDTRDPEEKTVYRFIRTLFSQAQLNVECAIVTLVYLERLLTYGGFELTPANWKRVTLGAIMLASKVWDDQAVWTVDYCQIFKDVSVEDMNTLERHFLNILTFNTNVNASVYAKYYFDLRELAETNKLAFNLEPLTNDQAKKLEAMSAQYRNDQQLSESGSKLKRASSLDGNTMNRSSLAIIS